MLLIFFVPYVCSPFTTVGHTKTYAQVLLDPSECGLGSVVDVQIESASRWSARGKVVATVHAAPSCDTEVESSVLSSRSASTRAQPSTTAAGQAAAGGCGDEDCCGGVCSTSDESAAQSFRAVAQLTVDADRGAAAAARAAGINFTDKIAEVERAVSALAGGPVWMEDKRQEPEDRSVVLVWMAVVILLAWLLYHNIVALAEIPAVVREL